jgi:hypothetical protein
MTTHEQALDQAVMKLLAVVAMGRHAQRPNALIVDDVVEQLPELLRLQGEVWLAQQAKGMRPRRQMSEKRRQLKALRASLGIA